MKIKKIYNNNIVLAEDESYVEYILMGKGVAYAKKVGDPVDESLVDKRFIPDAGDNILVFTKLLSEIPINHIELTNKIIRMAEEELDTSFNNSIYIGLADHINYAIHRYKENEPLNNVLLWEIQRFYQKEYQVAKKALGLIKYYEGIQMKEDEAAFIAMHFVNAQNTEKISHIVDNTNIIKNVLNIVKYHFKIEIDESSLNYSRFVTHLNFFLRRIKSRSQIADEDDFLFSQIIVKYPDAFECCLRIQSYLENLYEMKLTTDEMLYFILHVVRVTKRDTSDKEEQQHE
ncbi:transcription antiterminator BglG [Paenibacillus sp. FSL R7-0273]|uniref:BglG family transcription antiterminator LicT n=1 Tax=Paenibacillus sp. FSL R7-0273 TaxID=1536772 RepID=UPI0004F75FA2|nr:PRD domain-containing protein [Paenibacillus sp. FSL R7-0273]AIQ46141.1 transcription antiterminator BglG [Paenibacillus sp. FSL R7-0273]OMF92736.1 transcription antiterminator BglG [Paenibacillus sp. FSL R7-0273]